MSLLQINLFGRFRVRRGPTELGGFEAHKVQELLSYLLLYRDRPHARETLAGQLYADATTAQSRKALRQNLWQLQAALDQDAASPLLVVDADWIHLHSGPALQLDVADFEAAFGRAGGLPGRSLEPGQARDLEQAVESYQDDLLPGWYQDWCLFERERLQNMFLLMLDKLMAYCESRSAYEEGLLYGSRILRIDHARERTHWQMMRLYYLAGDRTGALRQYARCEAALADELGVAPSRRTRQLVEQIQADRLEGPTPAVTPDPPLPPVSADMLPELHDRLQQLQPLLFEAQRYVEAYLRAGGAGGRLDR